MLWTAAARTCALKPLPERLAAKMAGTDELGRAFPSNAIKAAEYGRKGALNPPQGQSEDAPSNDVSASTITETNRSDKTGAPAEAGENPNNAPFPPGKSAPGLPRPRAQDQSSGCGLTTRTR